MIDKKPDSPYRAFGAQPAEVELTPDDLKKFDLFTQQELDRMENWEMEAIRRQPYETIKALVDVIREEQKKRLDKSKEVC
jgi:hypothetical protein